MKLWKIFTGLFFILFAVFGLLDATGAVSPLASVMGEISLTQISVGLFLILLIGYCLIKSRICPAVMLVSLLFMVFERNIAVICGLNNHNIINNWLLILFTILICVGLMLILPKKFRGKWSKHITKGHAIGSNSVYIDSATFTDRYIENNMSSTVVKFENADAYIGEGILRIENNMGAVVINIPSDWCIDTDIENNLGSVQNRFGTGSEGPCLKIVGENNMGSIVIQKN